MKKNRIFSSIIGAVFLMISIVGCTPESPPLPPLTGDPSEAQTDITKADVSSSEVVETTAAQTESTTQKETQVEQTSQEGTTEESSVAEETESHQPETESQQPETVPDDMTVEKAKADEELYRAIAVVGGAYDPENIDEEPYYVLVFEYTKFFKMYFPDVVKHDIIDYVNYDPDNIDYTKDPLERMPYDYLLLDGEKTDWIFKNILNMSDETITAYYYYDGDYCTCAFMSPSYGCSVSDVEKLGGNLYYVTMYNDGWAPADPPYNFYALVTRKLVDGKWYWSVWRTSLEPLRDMADSIKID